MASLALSPSRHGMLDVPRTARADPTVLDLWMRKYDGLGPWTEAALAYPIGSVHSCNALVPPSEIAHTEFYADIHPFVADGLGCKLLDIPSCFYAVSFYNERHEVDSGMLARLEELAGHFVRAAGIEVRLSGLEARSEADSALLDQLPYALMTCTAEGRICSANRLARRILETGEGLVVRCDVLATEHPDEGALVDAFRRGSEIAEGEGEGRASTLLVRRTPPRAPLHLLVAPLSRERGPLSIRGRGVQPTILVAVTDPEWIVRALQDRIEVLFALTPRESHLTSNLVAGMSLAGYARAAEISQETARWILKRVLAKTGTGRQVDLVRAVMRSVASLEVGVEAMESAGGAARASHRGRSM